MDGGSVAIHVSRKGDNACVTVSDTGIGIPAEHQSRVFERFYRVEKLRSGPASTGLGLAICKHIVDRHGGRIWAEPGPGGCLKFTLPLAEAATETDRGQAENGRSPDSGNAPPATNGPRPSRRSIPLRIS